MSGKLVVGVDLGGTKILTALAGEEGRIINEVRVETEACLGTEAVLQNLFRSIDRVLQDTGVGQDRLQAIGVGAPGPLDTRTGVVHAAPNLGWREVPLGARLAERYSVPVFLDNDANLAALGEKRFGAGRGYGDLVYITVSTGVGCGLILNNRIYHGHTDAAGEIGHFAVYPATDGQLCGCGNTGCLETLVSGTALARQARELVKAGRGKEILHCAGGDPAAITARTIGQAAARGDAEALELIRRAGNCLGFFIANLVNLLNPSLVVIGGGVALIGRELFAAIEAEYQRRVLPALRNSLEIVPAALGERSGVMGAIALALENQEYFQVPREY